MYKYYNKRLSLTLCFHKLNITCVVVYKTFPWNDFLTKSSHILQYGNILQYTRRQYAMWWWSILFHPTMIRYIIINLLLKYTGSYAVGAKMPVKDFNRKKRKGGKMDHRWMGPFMITKCLGKGLYSLNSCSSDKTLGRVHGIHLKPYLSPLSSSNYEKVSKFLFWVIYSSVKYMIGSSTK